MCRPRLETQSSIQVLWLWEGRCLVLSMRSWQLPSREFFCAVKIFQILTYHRNRYADLAKAGFQVTDSTQSDLIAHLLERCGGHFVDIGTGVELLATKKVGIKTGIIPASYTASGLKFEDGSTLDADAIIWCTGFKDRDARQSISRILGDGAEAIQNEMDATWGVDAEGEVRGLWKRHANVDNFWIIAGGTAQHRWYSKLVALQIKGALEGILPEAYRAAPTTSQ